MREVLVSELVKEILGPRGGPEEVLDENPLSEYITGVLAPYQHPAGRDADSESELPVDGAQEYEDEGDDRDVMAPPLTQPGLDPRSRPSSMGLSFFLVTRIEPAVEICVTWARYVKEGNGRTQKWRRKPRRYIAPLRTDQDTVLWLDSTGARDQPDGAEVSLECRIQRLPNVSVHINLHLVNRLPSPSGQSVDTIQHIFQPQIRVVCRDGAAIAVGPEPRALTDEDRESELSYKARPVLARGYICSVVWKDIDPERTYDGRVDSAEAIESPPFAWIDSSALTEADSARFTAPDVRTEFVPLYSIPAPSLSWSCRDGSAPELRAGTLAELWDPEHLRAALSPLAQSYGVWVAELESRLGAMDPSTSAVARRNIERCKGTHARIDRGISLLCTDTNARLAFCFANRAADLQSRWSHSRPLTWWPFQLAFLLASVESLIDPGSPDRDVCDLLWVPTGAGKTEAYLGLACLSIAYRRRRALGGERGERSGAGVCVLTRYTLRLLTIQQFRRTASAVTACEFLRVEGLRSRNSVGWRPAGCSLQDPFLWGTTPISIGLWVGGEVTPNRIVDRYHSDSDNRHRRDPGAISILRGERGSGEPAQLLHCPACGSILAVPSGGLPAGRSSFHFVVRPRDSSHFESSVSGINGEGDGISIKLTGVSSLPSGDWKILSIALASRGRLTTYDLESIWEIIETKIGPVERGFVHPARPGYFLRTYVKRGGESIGPYDFEIFCPSPTCPLRVSWCEGSPTGGVLGRSAHPNNPSQPIDGVPERVDGNSLCDVQEPFRQGSPFVADRVRLNALTVDDQIFHRLPTIVISTVDKFARPAFDPKAAALFGNVEYHHCVWGYYRKGFHSETGTDGHPVPAGRAGAENFRQVLPLDPPELVIQDELHLVEGPLGSLVGLYETAVDFLCSEGGTPGPKYVASTATTRRAEEQVRSVFSRRLSIFPPQGIATDDRFFVQDREAHPLDDYRAGRLYLGICAPGRGPLTPIYRIWARLLQTVYQNRAHPRIDPFWTLTGYFNAIRELGGARALYRQDILERLPQISGDPRPLLEEASQELSSRTDSTDLPTMLDLLNEKFPNAQDALFTTSMFGTGVDVPRLGLMVVHGQPKTTSAYIQSTGRVGRGSGGLVVTFLRASRPRDLNHYEFFPGYHRQLHRFVEPITVFPFSPGCLSRGLGPVAVFLLRNMRAAPSRWAQDPVQMATNRRATEVLLLPRIFEDRAQSQPTGQRPTPSDTRMLADSRLDLWMGLARRESSSLQYVEYAIDKPPTRPVVLGDPSHQRSGLPVAYENAPSSLRTVEETTSFQT